MRRFVAAWVALCAAGCTSNLINADVAFINARVVDPARATVTPDQTVLVRNSRIIAVGNSLSVDSDTPTIDADGRYLVPGLAEMHAHVPKARDGEEFLRDVLTLFVANGVTTLRGMNGEAGHIDVRERIARNALLGPRLVTAGSPMMGKAAGTPAEARVKVQQQAADGFDFIKVHMGLPRDVYDAIADQAAQESLPIAGHVSDSVGLARALELGQASIDHLDAYWSSLAPNAPAGTSYGLMGAPLTPHIDPELIPVVARDTARAGVWNAPTLSMVENFATPVDQPPDELRYLPPKMRRAWLSAARGYQRSKDFDAKNAVEFLRLRLALVGALHDAGAGVLLASDAPQILNVPGFSIHRELELLVAAGLSPAEAIAAGTTEAARFFDRENEFGQIKTGLSADIIMVDANPLDDVAALRRPAGVMLRGRWFDRASLDAMLGEIEARYADE